MSDTPLSPRRQANRQAIVDAARHNLLSEGVAGLRFEQIAQTAGVTRKSVYNHFGSRAGLIEAIMDDIGRRADFGGFPRLMQIEDPAVLLSSFFEALAGSWQADRDMFRLMVGLSAADAELGAAIQARIGRVRQVSQQLALRLAAAPGLATGWTDEAAAASLFALSSFPTYDALCAAGLSQSEAAGVLTRLARQPFDWTAR